MTSSNIKSQIEAPNCHYCKFLKDCNNAKARKYYFCSEFETEKEKKDVL